jgi:hypothetical protein
VVVLSFLCSCRVLCPCRCAMSCSIGSTVLLLLLSVLSFNDVFSESLCSGTNCPADELCRIECIFLSSSLSLVYRARFNECRPLAPPVPPVTVILSSLPILFVSSDDAVLVSSNIGVIIGDSEDDGVYVNADDRWRCVVDDDDEFVVVGVAAAVLVVAVGVL